MFDREEIWGRDGNTQWVRMLDAAREGLRHIQGDWNVDGYRLRGRKGACRFGEPDWRSYEIKFGLQIHKGANAQIQLRLSPDSRQFYLVDFLFGWQAVGVARADLKDGVRGLQKLSVVNFPMRHNQEFKVEIVVRELSITTYVDGRLMNQVTDDSYQSGPFAFSVWESECSFIDPHYRVVL